MKKVALLAITLGVAGMMTFITSCKKSDSSSSATAMTLYDTLGGTTMVADPTNPSAMIEKGRLGIRS